MPVKDFYMTTPADVEPGDIFLVGLKAMVQYDGSVRLYRFRVEDAPVSGGVPQGAWVMVPEEYAEAITEHIMPVLTGRRLT